jgi:hypothetical protein
VSSITLTCVVLTFAMAHGWNNKWFVINPRVEPIQFLVTLTYVLVPFTRTLSLTPRLHELPGPKISVRSRVHPILSISRHPPSSTKLRTETRKIIRNSAAASLPQTPMFNEVVSFSIPFVDLILAATSQDLNDHSLRDLRNVHQEVVLRNRNLVSERPESNPLLRVACGTNSSALSWQNMHSYSLILHMVSCYLGGISHYST